MSVKSGFFNAINNDRLYDAPQIGQFFDGSLTNGVLSSIGKGFALSAAGGLAINIGSGLAYINGFYFYNSDDYEYTIPEEAFGTGEGAITGLEISEPPQTEYPVGNKLDLGFIKVDGLIVESCFLVIELDIVRRNIFFSYAPLNNAADNQFPIAIISRDDDFVSIEPLIGDNRGLGIVTGLLQIAYTNDLYSKMNTSYETFETEWLITLSNEFDAFMEINRYVLCHSDSSTQYSRFLEELDSKKNKAIVRKQSVSVGDTTKTFNMGTTITEDNVISLSFEEFGLIVTNISTNNTNIVVTFEPAEYENIITVIMD